VVSDQEVAGFKHHMDAYLSRLHDPNVAVRRGYASALGALPGRLLCGRAEEVCMFLCLCDSVCVNLCVRVSLCVFVCICMLGRVLGTS